MSINSPKPYPVVYDAETATMQYYFQDGYFEVPSGATNAITGLSGDVTATGPGIAVASISNSAVVAAKIAAGAITPSKISTSHTDLFTFPGLVTIDAGASANSDLKLLGTSVNTEIYVDKTDTDGWKVSVGGSTMLTAYFATRQLFLTNFDLQGNRILQTNSQIVAGIGTLDASAQMGALSTSKGFLPPVMTTTQKNAIASPTEGLMVYDLTLHAPCVWNGSAWKTVTLI